MTVAQQIEDLLNASGLGMSMIGSPNDRFQPVRRDVGDSVPV